MKTNKTGWDMFDNKTYYTSPYLEITGHISMMNTTRVELRFPLIPLTIRVYNPNTMDNLPTAKLWCNRTAKAIMEQLGKEREYETT